MAEFIAVVSFLSAVASLTKQGWHLVERMKDFQSETHEVPEAFKHLKAQLPITLASLKRTEASAKAGEMDTDTQEALIPALDGCKGQIGLLDSILDKSLPVKEDSAWERKRKAWKSVFKDKKTQKIVAELDRYIARLTFHNTSGGIKKAPPQSVPHFTMIPSNRDPNFIDRPQIFKELQLNLESHHRAALEGIGGVGKTQIAIEHCYRFRDEYPQGQVFWAHAGTVSKFGQACKAIAENLQLPGWNDPKTDVIALVKHWLSNEQNGPWLFIVDNADDIQVLEEPMPSQNGSTTLEKYLPRSAQGFVLITTRDKRLGERLAVRGKTIRVNAMTTLEGRQLLRSYLPPALDIDTNDLEELVSSLDYLPLAITQAAALITENGITIQEYLEMFRSSDEEMQQLLNESFSDDRRSYHESNSVIKTWWLSIDQITKQNPRAAAILSLMAMLDRQGIPATLLQQETEPRLAFTKAMGTLQAFSLVVREADKESYGMHRLVQLSTQAWLEVQNTTAKWRQEALTILERLFPEVDFENWHTCEVLSPHVRAVLPHDPGTDDGHIKRAILCGNLARFDHDQGRYTIAFNEAEKAFKILRNLLGSQDRLTLGTIDIVTLCLAGLGKSHEAMDLLQEYGPIQEQVLGVEHFKTLSCSFIRATLFVRQGNLIEAEAIYRRIITCQESPLGSNRRGILLSKAGLAEVLIHQNKMEEAKMLIREVINDQEREFGSNHPNTLLSLQMLATCLMLQGKWQEAQLLLQSVCASRERSLGAEHPSTLSAMSSLAFCLSAQGKLQEAEALFRAAYKTRERALGSEHAGTHWTMTELGSCLMKQDKLQEAEALFRAAYELQERVLGSEDAHTLWTMTELGSCLMKQDKLQEAEALFRAAYTSQSRLLGVEDHITLCTLGELATCLDAQGQHQEAEALWKLYDDIAEREPKAKQPEVLASFSDLSHRYDINQQRRWRHKFPTIWLSSILPRTHPALDDLRRKAV